MIVVGLLGRDPGQGQGEDVVGGVQGGVERLGHDGQGVRQGPNAQLDADDRQVHPENHSKDPSHLQRRGPRRVRSSAAVRGEVVRAHRHPPTPSRSGRRRSPRAHPAVPAASRGRWDPERSPSPEGTPGPVVATPRVPDGKPRRSPAPTVPFQPESTPQGTSPDHPRPASANRVRPRSKSSGAGQCSRMRSSSVKRTRRPPGKSSSVSPRIRAPPSQRELERCVHGPPTRRGHPGEEGLPGRLPGPEVSVQVRPHPAHPSTRRRSLPGQDLASLERTAEEDEGGARVVGREETDSAVQVVGVGEPRSGQGSPRFVPTRGPRRCPRRMSWSPRRASRPRTRAKRRLRCPTKKFRRVVDEPIDLSPGSRRPARRGRGPCSRSRCCGRSPGSRDTRRSPASPG